MNKNSTFIILMIIWEANVSNEKIKEEFNSKAIGFIIGGAVIGAIAGYIVNKIGYQNILSTLKANKIISPTISNLINEFTSRKKSDDDE
jgi:ribose/xylose/arabinose/galactoside ABC-type transport system permease subunit